MYVTDVHITEIDDENNSESFQMVLEELIRNENARQARILEEQKKIEEEENKRNASKSVIGIILPYLAGLLIMLFFLYTLLNVFSDNNWGMGTYITFIVVSSVSVCGCYLAEKDEILKLT